MKPFGLTEGEGVNLDSRAEKFDGEYAVGYRAFLPNELVELLLRHNARPVCIDVGRGPRQARRLIPICPPPFAKLTRRSSCGLHAVCVDEVHAPIAVDFER